MYRRTDLKQRPGGTEHTNTPEMLRFDTSSLGWGWRTKLLPFMDQGNLGSNLDTTIKITEGDNPIWVEESVETLICPSNTELVELRHPVAGIQMAMASYLGNGGSIEDSFTQLLDFSDGILMRSADDKHHGISLGAITDGTSNTFFCGETIAYAPLLGRTFIWDPAMYASTDNNGTASRTLTHVRTGHGELNPDWENSTDAVLRNSYASMHTSGAVFVFVDGSTHFISDSIDHNQLTEDEWRSGGVRGTYQRLFSRNDGLTVNDY